MKKTYSYKDCYQILGLNPETSWSDLRKRYKKLIQKWHPDRFDDDSKEKLAAEYKIKAINIAYNQIQKYYQANKALPPLEKTPETRQESKKTQSQAVTPDKKQESNKESTPSSSKNRKQADKKSKRSLVAGIIILSTLGSSYYFFAEDFYLEDAETSHINSLIANSKPKYSKSSENKDSEGAPEQKNYLKDNLAFKTTNENKIVDTDEINETPKLEEEFFTNGSTISDVIGVQGAPTKTDGDIWYYGKSEVHFNDGEVVHWVRGENTPLKARMVFDKPDSK